MAGVKSYEKRVYTFKKDNGEDVNFMFFYSNDTYNKFLNVLGIDFENIKSLEEAEKAHFFLRSQFVLGITLLIAWLGITGFLLYNLFTCSETVDTIKYVCATLFWFWFTCVRR